MAMTGFNPTEAQQQLQDFMEYGKKVYEKAANALNDLETNLCNNWCSPKAVDFGHDRISRLACIERDIDESIDSETNIVMTGQQSAAENLSA